MKQRVLTAALLIPPVLLAVFLWSPWWLYILALLAFGICYTELARLAGVTRAVPVIGTAVGLAWLFMPLQSGGSLAAAALNQAQVAAACAILASIGALGGVMIASGRRGYVVCEIASLWIIAPLIAIVNLKPLSADLVAIWDWSTPVLLCLIPLWIGDTLAIFAGRAFGTRPLAPKISPKKTVEGGIANLLGCIAGAIGVALLIRETLLVGLLAGLATGILGQAGDLLESAMKRSAAVKDSGTLLPGHGGLLDRIDSILLSAPFVALIVVAL